MKAKQFLLSVCLSMICALAVAQDDLYSTIKPLETAVQDGTATSVQQLELAGLYVKAGRHHEANKLANRVLAADAGNPQAIAIRDEATARLREAGDRAIAVAEERIRSNDATAADRRALADAYFDAGRYPDAADAYARLSEQNAEIRLRRARSLAWSGRMDDAERIYSEILKSESTPELELEYGRLLSWMGAARPARERLRALYDRTPNEASAIALANAMAWSGDRDRAQQLLTDFTARHPEAVEARQLLVELQSGPGLRLDQINKLIEVEPYNLALRMERARLLIDAGRYSEALKNIRFVREHSAQKVEGLDALEQQARQRRDEELAKATERRKTLDTRNPQTADEMLSLAKAYSSLEAYDEAVGLYEQYLRIRPDDVEVRIQYARVLSWDRRWSASARQYEKILEQHPDRADLRLELAQILSYGEDYVDAIRMFSSLTDLSANPRAHLYTDVPPRAHFNLGQIYRWFGWSEHAVAEQNRAIALDGGYIPARHELDLVRHVRPATTVDARYSYATDSNDFTMKRVDLEGEKWLSQRTAVQAAVGRHNFEHLGTSVNATMVSGGAAYRYNDRWTLRGRVGGNFYDEGLGTRPFWGVGAQWLPSIQSRAAFDYNHYDLIYDVFTLSSLTQTSPQINVRETISIDDFRAHYDYSTGGFWSVLGDASYGFISDDNRRAAAHGVVSFRVLKAPFVAIKADGRYLSYDFRTNRYWSPGDYKSLAGVLQVGQNIRDRFLWSAELKYGRSWEGNRQSDLRAYSGRVTVPINDAIDLVGNYGYGRSGRLDSIFGNEGTDFVNYWQRHWFVGVRVKQLFAGDDERRRNPYYYDNRVLTGSPVIPPMGETR